MLSQNKTSLIPLSLLLSSALLLSACNELLQLAEQNDSVEASQLDDQLDRLIEINDMAAARGGASVPDISEPMAQLGKKLFFSKALSGDETVACATCHHPALHGADQLSLPVGVNATLPDQLGLSRLAIDMDLPIGRNSPTVFNAALWRQGLFWDGRIERLGSGQISTPDSGQNQADPTAGATLLAAQAKFPVVTESEMLGSHFGLTENDDQVRALLAQRLGEQAAGLATNEWLSHFQQAFGRLDSADNLITFANIALAISDYERSMLFIDSPWQAYLDGDMAALSTAQKRGARLFLATPEGDGAHCVRCHQGPTFTDERFNLVAFPQFGAFTLQADGDVGRETVTFDRADRYRFRTPSLLNVELTAPYGHAGTYGSLEQVLAHYANPQQTVERYFANADYCDLPQFRADADCASLFPDAQRLSMLALDELTAAQQNNFQQNNFQQNNFQQNNGSGRVLRPTRLSSAEIGDLVAFLQALTDPCAAQLDCVAPWIAQDPLDNPDGRMLTARF
ncbi:cytochrome-c peroxidase [Reinekea sp.]|jgi:cytochrome c peroxidase|uniref:cytochrome-c peroxidase n=1 Tax=Reinekea sp. TaxID=1970455 RepID=UPI002A80B124|nr:cytochrome c peroxidase [Reinekea sp.]